MQKLEFILRQATDNDKGFIFNSFLQSYHQHSSLKFVPKTLYYQNQSDVIEYILKSAQVLIYCFPEDPESIAAYVMFEKASDTLILHWIYVKNLMRGKYLATDIVESIYSDNPIIIATHITDDFNKLRYKIKGKKIIYDPFYITNKRILCNTIR